MTTTGAKIFRWLRANCGKNCTAPLTSQDAAALVASVALTPLISWGGAPQQLFDAYRAIVMEMQPQTRWMAFHAIAIELDWSHRFMIWTKACLPECDKPKFKCKFES